MKPYAFPYNRLTPGQAMAAVHDQPYAMWLDSADLGHESGRYSYVALQPLETLEAKDGEITITSIQGQIRKEGDVFDILKTRLQDYAPMGSFLPGHAPFQGGALGYFGYDLARQLETLPSTQPPRDIPDMAIGIYDMVFAFDHRDNTGEIIVHAGYEEEAEKKYAHMVRLRSQKKRSGNNSYSPQWQAAFDQSAYEARVQRVIDYIRAGDIFQANFTQRFAAELPVDFSAFSHYLDLRAGNPAPFACFMNFGNGLQISSASPERFLRTTGAKVETKPIKGTRPRVADIAIDKLHQNALMNSEKEKAENTMIVDLLRNDLSRVCLPDSVEVTKLHDLESFASVHHLVSTIEGRMPNDKHSLDVLRAAFPGGSITGAPKIRAMEIIEELEQGQRGPYCGGAGYIGFNGDMDMNILIRTLVYEGTEVSFHTGGGITAQSDPSAEYQEMLDKAAAIFASFEKTGETRRKIA